MKTDKCVRPFLMNDYLACTCFSLRQINRIETSNIMQKTDQQVTQNFPMKPLCPSVRWFVGRFRGLSVRHNFHVTCHTSNAVIGALVLV